MWLIAIFVIFVVLGWLAIYNGWIGDIANILLFFLKWAWILFILVVLVGMVIMILNGDCGFSPG